MQSAKFPVIPLASDVCDRTYETEYAGRFAFRIELQLAIGNSQQMLGRPFPLVPAVAIGKLDPDQIPVVAWLAVAHFHLAVEVRA